MSQFNTFVKFLNDNKYFSTATKKIIKYKRVNSHTDEGKNTYYIHTGESVKIVTIVDGIKETENTCNAGDYVISGPKGEKYVVLAKKVPTYYNLLDEVLITRQQPRIVAKITKPTLKKAGVVAPVEFIASWGENMKLLAGDYLVKEDEGKYYRIEADVFKKTYKF